MQTEFFVASCRVYLEPLVYSVPASVECRLLGADGKPVDGVLHVELFPLGTDGSGAKAGGAGSGGVNQMPYLKSMALNPVWKVPSLDVILSSLSLIL